MDITYVTEDPAPAYSKGLASARTHEDLLEHVRQYREVAGDAIAHVARMSQADFEEFKRDLKLFRRAKGTEAERLVNAWGDIVLPAKMMTCSMVADQYKAPWGLAYIRLEESGWKILEPQP